IRNNLDQLRAGPFPARLQRLDPRGKGRHENAVLRSIVVLGEKQRSDGLAEFERELPRAICAYLPALLPLLNRGVVPEVASSHADKSGEVSAEPGNQAAPHHVL